MFKYKKKNSYSVYYFSLFLFVVLFLALGIIFWQSKKEDSLDISPTRLIVPPFQAKTASSSQEYFERRLDGVKVEKGQENLYPLAVVVENSVEARPLAGLEVANLVIETPVEGGITRYLAVFSGEDSSKIGPVRSARPYFIDWAGEFKALFAHVGGSPEALAIIKKKKTSIYDLDQYFWSKYYWRSSLKKRPHNVYTSTQLLRQTLKRRGLKEGNFDSWQFKEDSPIKAKETIEKIVCDFSFPQYKVEWRYNPEDNYYYRYLGGEEHLSWEGKQLKAKNVIFQQTDIVSLDKEDRKRIRTLGEDRAVVFQDGRAIEGRWKKKSSRQRTRFYNNEGEEIEFNRGPIWIEVGEAGVCSF